MRPLCDPYISPLAVIEYAGRMGRLEDVESLTFLNILRFVEQNKELVGNKKIFLNGIPGVEINDSNRSLIIEALGKHSNTIVIELTEHSELDDGTLEKVKNFYNDLGIQSAVDDYGTGYSNVVNLLRYTPDYVKIDRMLLAGIEDNPQKQHFVKEIVTFAHENSFKVLSEGVETSAELETCIRLGADYIQGFYTARPQKELIEDLDPLIREEIFRYYSKYSG
jgi:EAL domain-containing protein (putative c-di-GMP-specific phosphodiesterase class I)